MLPPLSLCMQQRGCTPDVTLDKMSRTEMESDKEREANERGGRAKEIRASADILKNEFQKMQQEKLGGIRTKH